MLCFLIYSGDETSFDMSICVRFEIQIITTRLSPIINLPMKGWFQTCKAQDLLSRVRII